MTNSQTTPADPQKRLLAIQERAKNATKGPWSAVKMESVKRVVYAKNDDYNVCTAIRVNAEFIAHARKDIPFLLDYIRTLEAEGKIPEGDCLPATLKNRCRQLSVAGRHYDARLMESAAAYLEQYRDDIVPELHSRIAELQKHVPAYTLESCKHSPKACSSKLCKKCYDRLAQQHRRTKKLVPEA